MNFRKKQKYAIFDMDGLMFDTERLLVKAFQNSVSKTAECEFPIDQLKQLLGLNFEASEALFKTLFESRIPFRECCKIADEWINEYIRIHGVPVKPGLYILLNWLEENGFHMAIATSSSRHTALFYAAKANVLSYFDVIISGDMIEKSKPDPQIFETAAEALGCRDKKECIILEDSENGLLAAARAKIPAIIIPDLIDPTTGREHMYFAKVATLSDVIPILEMQ